MNKNDVQNFDEKNHSVTDMLSLPHEILNLISGNLNSVDHLNFIEACADTEYACRDETKRKKTEYAEEKGVNHFCKTGNLEMVKYCDLLGMEFTTKDIDFAASENDHLEVVNSLHNSRKVGSTYFAMDMAAMNGHLEVVKWLHENRTEGCSVAAMDLAAANGHLETLKWLHENRTEGCSVEAMDWAASRGHLEIVKWLHENRTEGCSVEAIDLATQDGHFEVIKWLWENRTEGCTSDILDTALIGGFMEIVHWINEEIGFDVAERGQDTIRYCIEFGNLDSLKWIYKLTPETERGDLIEEMATFIPIDNHTKENIEISEYIINLMKQQ